MSGKHQGLRYFQKFLNSKASERNALAKKVLRCVLAVGFALSPWLGGEAYAAGIERIDNITLPNGLDKTYLQTGNDVAHIYAEQASGDVGLNRFKTFEVGAGQIANLYFKTSATDTNHLNTLVNTVQEQISISGTVNAIRNNTIGGNLYFLSPKGIIVGSTGVINAGNLTVLTLQQNMIDSIHNSDKPVEKANDTLVAVNDYIFDSDAHIDVYGNIIANGDVKLRSMYVHINVPHTDNVSTGNTSQANALFSSIVNTKGIDVEGDLELQAEKELKIENAHIESDGRLTLISGTPGNLASGTLDIRGSSANAQYIQIGVNSSIDVDSNSSIISGNDINMHTETGSISNYGTIQAPNVFNIQAGKSSNAASANLINGGTITATPLDTGNTRSGQLSITARNSITNTNTIQASGEVAFTVGGNLTNEGKIESTSSNVQAHIGRNFKNLGDADSKSLQKGFIQAGGNVQVDYNLDTEHTYIGVATPETGEKPTIDGIYNSGLIWAKGDKDPVKKPDGTVDANSGSGNIWLRSSYNIENTATGQMIAGRQITLDARDFLHNYGLIQGVTYLDIKSIMGYVYNHASGVIRATGGNIGLSTGQANLSFGDNITEEVQKAIKEEYRKFTPIIIEGLVEATSDADNPNNQTKEGNINITAHLGDIYVNGGTIETKPKKSNSGEIKAAAGNVTLDAAQNITIGFETVSARADDPTTQAGPDGENQNIYESDNEREYYKPKVDDTSKEFVSGNAAQITGTNIILISDSEANTVSMSEASSKIRLIFDSGAKGIYMSEVNNVLTASNAITISTDSMNIVGGTINAGTLAASNNLNITGGKITTNNITAGNELNVTGGEVSSNGSLELNGGGNVNIGSGASVKADKDIALTSSGADVNASSITLGGSLQLQGDNITVSDVQRSGNPTEPLNVKANSIGGTGSAINSLNLNITGNASFDSLNVKNAKIETTNGTLEVGQLKVEEKVELTSTTDGKSNSVDIYGKNATPEAGSGDVIRDTGDYVTIKIDDKGYEATVVGNNDNEGAVRLSTKLVDYDPYETYAEHYGDVADLFGRYDLIEASERSEGETAKDDGKAVLKQDEKGLRIEAKEA